MKNTRRETIVQEGNHDATGTVVAIARDRHRPVRGFLLVENDQMPGRYTIYTVLVNAKSSLAVARDIPPEVLAEFGQELSGGALPHVRKRRCRKRRTSKAAQN